MTIAQGVAKQSRWKRQTAKGTLAGTSGGQILRRESSKFALAKDTYTSENEMTSTQQLTFMRHGAKLVNGSLSGNLSPGTYSDQISALLRRDFTAVTAVTGLSITIAAASLVGGVQTYTITRSTGSWLSDGMKVGMVGRLTAGTFNAANLNKNTLIVGVTALALTVVTLNQSTMTAEGPIASATFTIPGKVTYVPQTGHTDIYFTEEEWYPDSSVSEVHADVKVTQGAISLPGQGVAKIDLTAMGLDQTTGASAYFTSPAAETTADPVVAASGALLVNGVPQALITDLKINIDASAQAAEPSVGTTKRSDIFRGKVKVSGSFTAYFEDRTISDLFTNETAFGIVSAFTNGAAAAADFMTFATSNTKLSSADPEDAETGNKRTYNYTAIFNAAGGAALANTATTLQVQDSLA